MSECSSSSDAFLALLNALQIVALAYLAMLARRNGTNGNKP